MNTLPNQRARHPDTGGETIAAYFRNPADGERAISDLNGAGFSKKDIGVAVRDGDSAAGPSTSGGASWYERFQSLFAPHERQEYDSEDPLEVLEHMGVPDEEGRYFKNA